ncbi:hypothetical protein LOSG293_130120 [Secundilactobacillus oryzae JCM 18671]|uniref:Uncharacterized protein n=1 Tax=Secundilactobacillus oryzae JCM 18671 TaxID=1291743 RepID=A0A081BIF5_9LACO|nr:hypothetical protein [Secundilactobacillus oryzae]GAK47823.1 hypothetical protein LOSG293_130120 [Secundilactobacillus oryzae JCM 18671]
MKFNTKRIIYSLLVSSSVLGYGLMDNNASVKADDTATVASSSASSASSSSMGDGTTAADQDAVSSSTESQVAPETTSESSNRSAANMTSATATAESAATDAPTDPETPTSDEDSNEAAVVIPADGRGTTTPTDPENVGENTSNISTVISAVQKVVASGNEIDFNVTVKSTGPKFTLHNAKLTLKVPDTVGIEFTQNVTDLMIAGTIPV